MHRIKKQLTYIFDIFLIFTAIVFYVDVKLQQYALEKRIDIIKQEQLNRTPLVYFKTEDRIYKAEIDVWAKEIKNWAKHLKNNNPDILVDTFPSIEYLPERRSIEPN